MKTKPFNIDEAKADAKVVTTEGRNVRIICWNKKGKYPILALVDLQDEEKVYEYDLQGYVLGVCVNRYNLVLVDEEEKSFKFKVGDNIYSKNNPDIRYKIAEVGIPNELGETDYRCVWIGEDSQYIKKGHERLISSEKVEEWAEILEAENPNDFEKGLFDVLFEITNETTTSKKFALKYSKMLIDLARKELEENYYTKVLDDRMVFKSQLHACDLQRAYDMGKEDALQDIPKWKKSGSYKFGCGAGGWIRLNHNHTVFPHYTSDINKGDYYLNFFDLKKLPKED